MTYAELFKTSYRKHKSIEAFTADVTFRTGITDKKIIDSLFTLLEDQFKTVAEFYYTDFCNSIEGWNKAIKDKDFNSDIRLQNLTYTCWENILSYIDSIKQIKKRVELNKSGYLSRDEVVGRIKRIAQNLENEMIISNPAVKGEKILESLVNYVENLVNEHIDYMKQNE